MTYAIAGLIVAIVFSGGCLFGWYSCRRRVPGIVSIAMRRVTIEMREFAKDWPSHVPAEPGSMIRVAEAEADRIRVLMAHGIDPELGEP